ncbi:MAG: TetR/AcrR family transcriptional regulator [Polyangiaceae bacterium]|nr:TetR/AcrR family transcriptional regulator [Polyangiaceae bacterium]
MKERILAAACELFAERGVDAVALDAIAKRARLSIEQVRRQFGGKRPLYEACLQASLEEMRAFIPAIEQQLATSHLPLPLAIAEGVHTGVRFVREHRIAVRLLQRSLLEDREEDARFHREAYAIADELARICAGVVGKPRAAYVLPLRSIVVLVVRYALGTERDGEKPVAGDDANAPPRTDPKSGFDEYLTSAVAGLLGISSGARRRPTTD